jgi:Rod binding domain-containing protein
MNIDSINMNKASVGGPEKSTQELRAKQLKQASVDFESMLLQQMFQAMEKTLDNGSLIGGGLSGNIYSGFLTEAISKEMASHQSLGLSDQLYKQVLRHEPSLQKAIETKEPEVMTPKEGLKIGHDIPLENARRGLGYIQMLKAQPLLQMTTETAKTADINSKAKL